MKIDLHIHSRSCSDGKMTLAEIFEEAKSRGIEMISITDHDSVECQPRAIKLAEESGIRYVTGVELNVTFMSASSNRAISVPAKKGLLGFTYTMLFPNLEFDFMTTIPSVGITNPPADKVTFALMSYTLPLSKVISLATGVPKSACV